MRALILALGLLGAFAAGAHAQVADTVAFLPLDAGEHLELYGQPVAHEIALALLAEKVEVVVVGPKMAVPDAARLIVDGTIIGKGATVVLTLRVRNPVDGMTLETLQAIAPKLENLDSAAADISARLLVVLREKLGSLPRRAENDHGHVNQVRRLPTTPGRPPVVLVAVSPAPPSAAPLQAPLVAAIAKWTKAHHREQLGVEPNKLIKYYAPKTVAATSASLAVSFEILGFDVWPDPVLMARARVHVVIAGPTDVLFDRVIATDSVVGDKGKTIDDLAVRVADEVLAILRPHILRNVPTW